jgi:2-keto-myo-inositol isomerase
MDRRRFLKAGVGLGTVPAVLGARYAPPDKKYQKGASIWPLCLNTSTIRPSPLKDKIRIAAEAGYDGIEPWMDELEKHEAEGGDLKALGREIRDRGLFVPNVVGLWDSIPADKEAWERSLAATRRRMRMAAAVGSRHVASIPAPDRADFDLKWGAERYRDLLKMGRDEFGMIVACEFVGFMKGINRLGLAAAIALDADDTDACLICDTFHLYRGGSGFHGLDHLAPGFIADFHWNDVPADPPREQLGDKHRIYPGDGILPLKQVLAQLAAIKYTGPLSLEMFNREYWKQDPAVVAKTGLTKMREQVATVLASLPSA